MIPPPMDIDLGSSEPGKCVAQTIESMIAQAVWPPAARPARLY
ncbi:hypothetical protein RM533_05330 [Croceicoccus sp. F390]|uniref:Uncharacterized protein n=1 Tax=Croceicoccus esteveae TaxID=3075597 RepID=A0ABU2ZG88_9SPHN|nr:hypothetical protein [Croceicoccus sp. F390]MDT0575600.1 hypothetical protein [Croceicoccus sp. F390]